MLGPLIAAGSSIIGGLLGQSSAEKNAKRQEALQREFAQNSIQWKAADAEKAGISKVFAMGAPTTSYAPVSVGASPLGSSVADAGQHIGRAMEAQAGPAARVAGVAAEIQQAQLDGLKIDNDIKRADLLSKMATRNQPGQPPPILDSETTAIPGQGNSGIKLEKQISPSGSLPQKSFGVSPEVDMWRTSRGYAPEVPQALGEAQESQPLSAAQWFIRNKIMPQWDYTRRTPPYPSPPGTYWGYNLFTGEYDLRELRRGVRIRRPNSRGYGNEAQSR